MSVLLHKERIHGRKKKARTAFTLFFCAKYMVEEAKVGKIAGAVLPSGFRPIMLGVHVENLLGRWEHVFTQTYSRALFLFVWCV